MRPFDSTIISPLRDPSFIFFCYLLHLTLQRGTLYSSTFNLDYITAQKPNEWHNFSSNDFKCPLPTHTHSGSIGSRGFLSAIVERRTEEWKIKMAQRKRNNWKHYTCIGRIILDYLKCFRVGQHYLLIEMIIILYWFTIHYVLVRTTAPLPYAHRTMEVFESECHFNAFTTELSHLLLICILTNSHPRVDQP